MKYLAIFLSVYIILLSGMPCPDVVKQNSFHKLEFCKAAPGASLMDTDHCSPVCSCQCCQVNFSTAEYLEIPADGYLSITFHENTPSIQEITADDFVVPPEA